MAGLAREVVRRDRRAMRWLLSLLFGLVVLAQPSARAGGDRLAELLALPVASELTGAAAAPRFAWVVNEAGVRNVWTGAPGQPARRLTNYAADDGEPIYDLALSRDGRALAFVKGGDGEHADDDVPNPGNALVPPAQRVFVADTTGGAPALIGEGHSPAFAPVGDRIAYSQEGELWLWTRGQAASRKLAEVPGDIGRLEWSPDGRRLAFAETRPGHSLIGLIELDSARLSYAGAGLGRSVEPTFSPDGAELAFVHYLEPPPDAAPGSGPYWSLRVADLATGAVRIVWSAPKGEGARYGGTRGRNLYWSADRELVFPWERTGWLHAYALDARRGGEPRALTAGDFELDGFLLAGDGRTLIYAAKFGERDRRHVWRRPLNGGRAVQLSHGGGIESFPTVAGDALAVIATDAIRPAYPALVGGDLTPLATPAEARGFVAPEAVTFRAEDGLEVRGQFFRSRVPGKRPAVVWVHGGPLRQMLLGFHPSGYYSNAYIMNQHLAAEGFNVLSVNYRGGTGYGRAFREAPGTGREGASEYRDVLAAGRWLAARGDVDPQRIGLWGGSWGGYLTALALARDSGLFKAGVDFHGVHSLLRPVPNSLSPEAQEAARRLQWKSSPLAAIERWRSPVLLIHGGDDRNVDFAQSLLLARELAARGIPYEELVFPNERHSFLRHAHWRESFERTEAFLKRHLAR
jgi:dipeptidyl aminopeptidase/acylaminoacyl peptidase